MALQVLGSDCGSRGLRPKGDNQPHAADAPVKAHGQEQSSINILSKTHSDKQADAPVKHGEERSAIHSLSKSVRKITKPVGRYPLLFHQYPVGVWVKDGRWTWVPAVEERFAFGLVSAVAGMGSQIRRRKAAGLVSNVAVLSPTKATKHNRAVTGTWLRKRPACGR